MILLDTETTGVIKNDVIPLKDQPHLVEFFGLKLDDATLEEQGELGFICKPPISLSDEITKITGLTNADIKDKLPFVRHIIPMEQFFLGEATMVAHNLPFDRQILYNEMARLDRVWKFPWPSKHVCTVEIAQELSGGKYLQLGDLYQLLFGRQPTKKHRAGADVYALAEIVRELRRRGLV